MNCFEILGIEPTEEIRAIKRAYAARSRTCHPEEHPEEFQILHRAYEEALAYAKRERARAERAVGDKEPGRKEEAEPGEKVLFAETEGGCEDENGRAHDADYGDKADQKEESDQGKEPKQGKELEQGKEPKQGTEPDQGKGPDQGKELERGKEPNQEESPALEEEQKFNSGELYSSAWDERFAQLAEAGMRRAQINTAVRWLMEEFHAIYMDEKRRNRLYLWRNFFDEPFGHRLLPVIFSSREFVEGWYHFLGSHHQFTPQIWQYFATLDGYRFHSEQYGIPRFPYSIYMERSRQEQAQRELEAGKSAAQQDEAVKREERETTDTRRETGRAMPPRPERTVVPGGKGPQKKEPQNKGRWPVGRVIRYVLCMLGAEIGGIVIGTIAALLFG